MLKLHDKAKSLNDVVTGSCVLKEWCSEEKFKSIVIDVGLCMSCLRCLIKLQVMVHELGTSPDVPMELALAKLSSMVTSSANKSKTDGDGSAHQKQVLIEGLTTL